MPGYQRSFNRNNGDLVEAPDFVNEYEALDNAFESTTGHTHDGTPGHGGYVGKISDQINRNELSIDNINNKIVASVNVGGIKTAQLEVVDGAIVPVTDVDIDLGSAGKKFKDLHVGGSTNLNILSLASGVPVQSIYDDDTMAADSATALVSQQSVKAYVDNSMTGHMHDGAGSSIIPAIGSSDGLNTVEVDGGTDTIIISTDVVGVKTSKVKIDSNAIYPTTPSDMSVGSATNKFDHVYSDNLTLGTGVLANAILNESDMVSDSPTAIPTQQSVKSYVDTAPGIFRQATGASSVTVQALTGSLAVYLSKNLTVQANSAVHIECQIEGELTTSPGRIYGRIFRDTTAVSVAQFVIAHSTTVNNVVNNTFAIAIDGPLTAGTYTYTIQVYVTGGGAGNIRHASMILKEQAG